MMALNDLKGGGSALLSDSAPNRALAMDDQELWQRQKLEVVGQLAGGAAHEFNNLLQAISGYATFALKDIRQDARAYQYLQKIHVAVDRAAQLTRQLLRFGRVDDLHLEAVDPAALLREVCDMLPPLLGEQIQIKLSCITGLPQIQADAAAIHQLFVNLALNSRDAMPEGGLLHLDAEMVDVTRQSASCAAELLPGRYVRFSVIDTGCGMSPGVLQCAFEPFFTTKEFGRGSGLGLAVAYGVAKQHGGTISIESEPGVGTRVELHIPACVVAGSVPELADNGDATGALVLIADDEPFVREIAVNLLHDSGYQTIAVEDGLAACDAFARHADQVDLLLFDIVMPRLSGYDAYCRIQQMNSQVPAVFCTGYDPNSVHSAAIRSGGHCIVEKPFRAATLLRAIRQTLDRVKT